MSWFTEHVVLKESVDDKSLIIQKVINELEKKIELKREELKIVGSKIVSAYVTGEIDGLKLAVELIKNIKERQHE